MLILRLMLVPRSPTGSGMFATTVGAAGEGRGRGKRERERERERERRGRGGRSEGVKGEG